MFPDKPAQHAWKQDPIAQSAAQAVQQQCEAMYNKALSDAQVQWMYANCPVSQFRAYRSH
jgi:hypothetical protein